MAVQYRFIGGLFKNKDKNMENQESVVMDKLSEVWNEFLKLEPYHLDEVSEFRISLHALQKSIMSRKVMRDQPNAFNKIKNTY